MAQPIKETDLPQVNEEICFSVIDAQELLKRVEQNPILLEKINLLEERIKLLEREKALMEKEIELKDRLIEIEKKRV